MNPSGAMTDLLYSDVEEQLRASVRGLLDAKAPWTSVLARTESTELYDRSLWTALARDLGVAGLAIAESAGGSGGPPANGSGGAPADEGVARGGVAGGGGASWREVAVVAEELGRSVAGTAFLGSAVLSTAAALSTGDDELLAGLATGTTTAALAVAVATLPGAGFPDAVRLDGTRLTGTVRSVVDASVADVLLVPAVGASGEVIARVPASEAQLDPVVSLDMTRPLTDVTFAGSAATVIADGGAANSALQAALLAGAVVLASEQVGLAQRCLDMSVEYLRTRYQFGRQIGSFQALKHRAADVWSAITQARAVARYAAACLAGGDADTAVAASVAQAYCSPVAVQAAEECVQLHGGLGFTWEHPAHLYLKRAKADAVALGTASRHRARLGELVALPVA